MAASLTQSVTNATGVVEQHKNAFGLDVTGRIDHILTTADAAEVTTEDYQFSDNSDAPTAITTHTAAAGGVAGSV